MDHCKRCGAEIPDGHGLIERAEDGALTGARYCGLDCVAGEIRDAVAPAPAAFGCTSDVIDAYWGTDGDE